MRVQQPQGSSDEVRIDRNRCHGSRIQFHLLFDRSIDRKTHVPVAKSPVENRSQFAR